MLFIQNITSPIPGWALLLAKARLILACCLLAAVFSLNAAPASLLPTPPAEGKNVLILYDNAGEFGHTGKEHAILLENLLGHFNATVTLQPVFQYQSGQLDGHDVVFYIGSTFDVQNYWKNNEQQNYQNYLADVAATNTPIVWINHNLRSLVEELGGPTEFINKYGFQFLGIDNDRKFNRVEYKNVELHKGVVVYANPGTSQIGCTNESNGEEWKDGIDAPGPWACDTVMNTVRIVDTNKVTVYATAYSTHGIDNELTKVPYVTRSENFWYIGDLPFMFFSEEDRYLVFADLLHEILDSGINEQEKYILLRLEDISPHTNTLDLEKITAYLELEKIPFTFAAVAAYKDPKGINNNDVPQYIKMPGSSIAKIIKRYYDKGIASVVMHGYSHQWSNENNPFSGITGEDFEFFRVTMNDDNSLNFVGSLPGDSARWAANRITDAAHLFLDSGFKAFAWEAAHYMASETAYLAIREVFPIHYGRLIYFSDETPNEGFFGQFFPYPIDRDSYGYQLIPENMGNVTLNPVPGYREVLPDDLVRYTEKLSVVRDRVASFFYHPALGVDHLKEVVDGARRNGYRFISPCDLGYECNGNAVVIPEKSANITDSDKNSSNGGSGSIGSTWILLTITALMAGPRRRKPTSY